MAVGPASADTVASINGPSASEPLTVTITHPLPNQPLGSSSLVVEWDSNVLTDDLWFYEAQLDSGPVQNTGTTNHTSFEGIADGYHTVRVWVHDNSGAQAYDSRDFIVDTSAPILRIVSPGNNTYLNYSDVTVTWSASDPSYISYFDAVLDLSVWAPHIMPTETSQTFPGLSEGHHNITVTAYDRVGKSASRTVEFVVDTTIPSVTIESPDDGHGYSSSEATVVWSGSDLGDDIQGYEIWSNGAYVTTTASTASFFHFTNLKDGYYSVMVKAVDLANNTDSDTVTFFVDTVDPQVVNPTPTGSNVPVDAPITVTFTKEMNRTATHITVEGVDGSTIWDGNNATFVPDDPLDYGSAYNVSVVGKDLVNNPVSYGWSFITTDMGVISGVVLDSNGNPMSGATVTLDGNATVVTNDTGSYSFTAHAGDHTLVITKPGFDQSTVQVDLQAGKTRNVADVAMSPSSMLGELGWLAAIAAVVIVALLFYFSQKRKKQKGPPVSRSWRGMSELQRRANKGRKKNEDDEDDERI